MWRSEWKVNKNLGLAVHASGAIARAKHILSGGQVLVEMDFSGLNGHGFDTDRMSLEAMKIFFNECK